MVLEFVIINVIVRNAGGAMENFEFKRQIEKVPSHLEPRLLAGCSVIDLGPLEPRYNIYEQGSSADVFYYIEDGIIGLYHVLESGKETLMRLYREREYFGYRTLFSPNQTYHCSAKVMTKAHIKKIAINDSNGQFLMRNPDLSLFLIQRLAAELQDAEHRLAKIAFTKSLDRVFESILFLTRNFPEYKWTYREIAEYVGCETETAIRISRELKKTGLLDAHSR